MQRAPPARTNSIGNGCLTLGPGRHRLCQRKLPLHGSPWVNMCKIVTRLTGRNVPFVCDTLRNNRSTAELVNNFVQPEASFLLALPPNASTILSNYMSAFSSLCHRTRRQLCGDHWRSRLHDAKKSQPVLTLSLSPSSLQMPRLEVGARLQPSAHGGATGL